MSATPTYTITPVAGSDRMVYTAKTPWPKPGRENLHMSFDDTIKLMQFECAGRPCDVRQQIPDGVRRQLRARRQTPRGDALEENV
jgi:hypothetical protein